MNTALSWIKAYVPDLDVTAQDYTDAMTPVSYTHLDVYKRQLCYFGGSGAGAYEPGAERRLKAV